LHERDQLRQGDEEDGAEEGAVHEAQAADDHQQQQLDGLHAG
jgi:hypothetical protein